MSLQKSKARIHRLQLLLRNLERFIDGDDFIAIYSQSTDDERHYILTLINTMNLSALRDWVERQKNKDPSAMSVVRLRDLARLAGIPNYGSLSKATLLSELKKAGEIT